ncbi:MAG: efflux RND transporter periplasmic adaptor subunit [Deltaproteobacteria bacterium]|nr:efflux RND transporter periplasmic adaptor subunit [Deltaproteobacteria bacterium]
MGKKKKIIAPIAVVLAVISITGGFLYFRSVENNGELELSGHVEVTEVNLSFRLPGHVEAVLVEEGSRVNKGDVLARLKQTIYQTREIQARAKVEEIKAYQAALGLAIKIKEGVASGGVAQARAGVSAAEARYQSLKSGSRLEEIRAARAVLDRVTAEYEKRRLDFERMKRLVERKIISNSDFENARTGCEAAKAEVESAQEKYKLVQAGPRQETVEEGRALLSGSNASLNVAKAGLMEVQKMKLDLEALRAQLAQAEAMYALARDDLAETRIHAPLAGFISVKNIEEGEFVQIGAPVMSLVKLDRVWVKVYVPETRLGHVRLGQPAEVTTDSFPDKKYPGVVSFISPEAEFTPKNVQTREERVKLVYRIKVSLDNPDQELKPGMPVDIRFR